MDWLDWLCQRAGQCNPPSDTNPSSLSLPRATPCLALLHNLLTKRSLSTQPVIGPTLVTKNFDNGGMPGLGEGTINTALEQRLQAIEGSANLRFQALEEGIARIESALTRDSEASAKMPEGGPGARGSSASPEAVIAEASFPFESGAHKATSHPRSLYFLFLFLLSLHLGFLCLHFQTLSASSEMMSSQQ